MLNLKKKFNCFNLSFLSFHFIPQSIVLSTFKIFPTEKSFCFRDAKKKKKIVFMPANVRATLKLAHDVYMKFYKLSDSMTILGITYVGILEETECRIRASNRL